MFNQSSVDKWFKEFNRAFSNMDRSIDKAGDRLESHLKQRTDSLTPTLSRALINSRRIEQELDENSWELKLTYNGDGSAPYAIEQHNAPYGHDYGHNPTEVQSYTGGTPLLYVWRPLIQEREEWWKRIFSKVGWK